MSYSLNTKEYGILAGLSGSPRQDSRREQFAPIILSPGSPETLLLTPKVKLEAYMLKQYDEGWVLGTYLSTFGDTMVERITEKLKGEDK